MPKTRFILLDARRAGAVALGSRFTIAEVVDGVATERTIEFPQKNTKGLTINPTFDGSFWEAEQGTPLHEYLSLHPLNLSAPQNAERRKSIPKDKIKEYFAFYAENKVQEAKDAIQDMAPSIRASAKLMSFISVQEDGSVKLVPKSAKIARVVACFADNQPQANADRMSEPEVVAILMKYANSSPEAFMTAITAADGSLYAKLDALIESNILGESKGKIFFASEPAAVIGTRATVISYLDEVNDNSDNAKLFREKLALVSAVNDAKSELDDVAPDGNPVK